MILILSYQPIDYTNSTINKILEIYIHKFTSHNKYTTALFFYKQPVQGLKSDFA